MAEIHVQQKKSNSSTWVWILVSLIVVLALAFVLIWSNNNKILRDTDSNPAQTSVIQYQSLPAA